MDQQRDMVASSSSSTSEASVAEAFDDLDGKFLARLREIASTTRTTADGKASITFKTARIEASYSPDAIKALEAGRLIAIPNVMGVGTNDIFSIYEVADVYPMHYSMLTLDKSQPGAIRKEFMSLIDKEWQSGNSKSTWIEIVAAPTGYVMRLEGGGEQNKKQELKFIRKNAVPLTGSLVYLLSKDTIQKFICYTPKDEQGEEGGREEEGEDKLDQYTIGHLLGVTEEQVPFTVNIEKLLHYHVGVFAFTGSGKSNFTSLTIRKAIHSVPDLKFVIFDVSSEYGISILDLLKNQPSRVIFSEEIRGKTPEEKAKDYFRRHVVPERFANKKDSLLKSIEQIVAEDKIRTIAIESESEEGMRRFATYEGLLESLADLTNDKYGAASSKVLIPTIADMIRSFMSQNKLEGESPMGKEIEPLIKSINEYLGKAKLAGNATILGIFANLQLALSSKTSSSGVEQQVTAADDIYDSSRLVEEIMDTDENSPKLFIINLPEAETARVFCTEIINKVFRFRKNNFTLDPKVVFVFDEAQEFIPAEKKREDGTEVSSRVVERLLRHGRKYNLHGWISTQRIAHLNTNALQQLHSYFVSTMPRPYDRQLISDTFAIDDAFVERTLMFQNGDWLMTSFKATNTQNVPVFFHAINNEDFIAD